MPRIAIILGSGLGDFAGKLRHAVSIETSEIPYFPRSTVEGHRGRIVIGELHGVPLLVFQGRVHFYETGILGTILYPVMVAKEFGIERLLVTNAAGGVNPAFRPGDLMLITDQLNFTFKKPLENRSLTSTSAPPYDAAFSSLILNASRAAGIKLRKGVYCGVTGPSYETAAEIRMIRRIGADAVGMSTVNEVSYAAKIGMKVAGISCITNLSTGMTRGPLSHAEVTIVADRVTKKFSRLLERSLESIPPRSSPPGSLKF